MRFEKWMTEKHRMSPIIRDLSEVTDRKDGGTGECVLKSNINNMEFYNELLLQRASQCTVWLHIVPRGIRLLSKV